MTLPKIKKAFYWNWDISGFHWISGIPAAVPKIKNFIPYPFLASNLKNLRIKTLFYSCPQIWKNLGIKTKFFGTGNSPENCKFLRHRIKLCFGGTGRNTSLLKTKKNGVRLSYSTKTRGFFLVLCPFDILPINFRNSLVPFFKPSYLKYKRS